MANHLGNYGKVDIDLYLDSKIETKVFQILNDPNLVRNSNIKLHKTKAEKLADIKDIIGYDDNFRLYVIQELIGPKQKASQGMVREVLNYLTDFTKIGGEIARHVTKSIADFGVDNEFQMQHQGPRQQESDLMDTGHNFSGSSHNNSTDEFDRDLQLALAISEADAKAASGNAQEHSSSEGGNNTSGSHNGHNNQRLLTLKEYILDEIIQIMRRRFDPTTGHEIKTLLSSYDEIGKLQKIAYGNMHVNDASVLVLRLCDLFKYRPNGIKDVLAFAEPLVHKIYEDCYRKKIRIYNEDEHKIDETVKLHPIFLEKYERIHIKGDGNCLWNSVSVALFGDYSYMESLRLLTAATLTKYEKHFKAHFEEQSNKFGYKHELTFDNLITAATELGIWGDEYHLLTLSVALRRPIYSYGNFAFVEKVFGPSKTNASYEKLQKFYEDRDHNGQYRYVGFEVDEEVEPICLYYNGETHYCVILPRSDYAYDRKPLKPKTLLLEYVIKDEEKRQKAEQRQKPPPVTPSSSVIKPDIQRRKHVPDSTSLSAAYSSISEITKFPMETNLDLPDNLNTLIDNKVKEKVESYSGQDFDVKIIAAEAKNEIIIEYNKGMNNTTVSGSSSDNYNKVAGGTFDNVRNLLTDDENEEELQYALNQSKKEAILREEEKDYEILEKLKREELEGKVKLVKVNQIKDKKNSLSSYNIQNMPICNTCFTHIMESDIVVIDCCLHFFCKSCFSNHMGFILQEETYAMGKIAQVTCPTVGCSEIITDSQMERFLPEDVYKQLLDLTKFNMLQQQQQASSSKAKYQAMEEQITHFADDNGDVDIDGHANAEEEAKNIAIRHCPRTGCGKPVFGDMRNLLGQCDCGYAFCINCYEPYHGFIDCGKNEEENKKIFLSYKREKAKKEPKYFGKTMSCPRCHATVKINKNNSLIDYCPYCKATYCRLCLDIFKANQPRHFQSCQLFGT